MAVLLVAVRVPGVPAAVAVERRTRVAWHRVAAASAAGGSGMPGILPGDR